MLPFSRRLLGMCLIKVFRVVSILTLCSSSIMSVAHGAPESMGIPIIKSLLERSSSADGLKEMMEAHSDKLFQQLNKADQSEPNPTHLNNLISKLKPKQGRMDPVVADMLSAFDRKYRDTTAQTGGHSEESYNFPNEPATNRMASSTEENGIIWQGATNRPRRRDKESSKFSSRYRSNKTEPVLMDYGGNRTGIYNDTDHNHSAPPTLPFNHITDPNIRNHRLYDWEFETYKNFTHIDQAEDLMADEDHISETKVSVVAAPPLNLQKSQKQSGSDRAGASIKNGHHEPKSKRVKVKGIPHIVISLEDTSDNSPYNHHGSNGYNLHLPVDSGERLMQRPREPLRHSSTENIVYVHGTSGEDTMSIKNPWSDPRGSHSQMFRPSSSDLTDAVFIDPDQDFFTSTVRSGDPHNLNQDQEISSEAQSKRRRKKLKKYSNNEELASGSRFNNRMGEMSLDTDSHNYNGHAHNQISDEDQPNPNIVYSPVYSRNTLVGVSDAGEASRAHNGNVHQTPGPHMPLIKPSYHTVENSHIKSDRILYPGSEHQHMESIVGQVPSVAANFDSYQHQHQPQPSGHHMDLNGGIGNYYQLHSEAPQHVITTNMGGIPSASENVHPFGHKNQQEMTSTEYLGGSMNRLQNALSSLPFNFFGLQQQQPQQQSTKKLMASPADQVIAPGNIEDFYHPYAAADHQVNQYYEDNPYYSNPWSNTWFVLAAIIGFTAVFALVMPSLIGPGRLGKKDTRHDLDEDDLNSSNGNYPNYYNNYQFDNTTNDVQQNSDIWTEIKGVYNDIVNLFRGDFSLLSKLRKEPEGPKIVYRDENDQDQEDSDEDEEDDEKSDNRVPLRHRKRQDYLKKQKILKKQQQNKRQRERERDRGNKSSKKSLISKTKAEAGRGNKTHGKTIDATSVNNLVVVSGPGGPTARDVDENHSSPRSVTGFVFPENSTLATMPLINATGFGSLSDSFLREWAEVQLINHLNH